MNNEDEKNMVACLAAMLALVLIPLLAILQGWVLTVLWGWFVVPTFHAPELNIVTAIGLTLVVGMFKGYSVKTGKKSENEKLTEAVAVVIMPFIFLFLGWIVHLFM